ncbi:MAG: bifunctional demethylmenaquinone methyltransferase/2-methoxy-6-polyprenyl-1,4-benzoquinol methylase UbiE [Deltaproteobacteria bacterium]|nr:bifunctional demethylmenaquinone methyltransferase/2-methoxy-6-polyprenyl-1,4-benzoquinol methylase UbiE [Deltaproteobacteria bacterium]
MVNSLKKSDPIREMFAKIAPRYDFLNRLLSLGIDRRWRRSASKNITAHVGGRLLDIATGTGDMALEAARATNNSVKIIGVDYCAAMVEIGRDKIHASLHRDRVALGVASCEALPFRNNAFDAATIAFGIRNVADRSLGLREILRTLLPGGVAVILEFSNPKSRLFKAVYHFYFRRILPAIGGLFSDSGAYQYLPDSVLDFPEQEVFKKIMIEAGFENVSHSDYTFGIVTCYVGKKPVTPNSPDSPLRTGEYFQGPEQPAVFAKKA